MKLIKLMLAGMVVMSFALAQDDTQGGQATGPPPCDPNATYPVADPGPDGGCANYNDCNSNGVYDAGEPCGDVGGQGPPQGDDQGPPTCDVCGYTFAGEGDHHGHCDRCDFVFTSDNDQHGHCDQCDYIFSGEGDQHGHCDKCDHIWSGDPEDHHGHCDHEGCDFVGNTNEDWENHSHDDGGTGGPGGAPTNHWDGNCAAMCGGHGEYWLDSDGDGQPEDGPYATWDHDADGNPVDCGCGGDDGDHDGDEGDHDGDEGDHDGDEGDHDDQGGQCRYEGCDFVGSTDDDWRGHCDANPDHCRPQAGDTCDYGHDGDEACDYVFTGDEGEDHHHCDTCGVAMSSGQDMDQHCQDNPEHCRPRAGDTCECGFTFAGTDADENHRHCPTCNAQFDNDGDMGQHCQDNEGHCGDNNDQN